MPHNYLSRRRSFIRKKRLMFASIIIGIIPNLSPHLKFWTYIPDFIKKFRKTMIDLMVIVILLLLLWFSINELSKDLVVINFSPVSVEFQRIHNGFTNEVCENHLMDSINKINKIASSYITQKNELDFGYARLVKVKDEITRSEEMQFLLTTRIQDFDIRIQDVGISINAFFQFLKSKGYFQNIFNYRYAFIGCDITSSGETGVWNLTIRLDNKKTVNSGKVIWKGEETFLEVAKTFLEQYNLDNLIAYYFSQKEYCSVINVCQKSLTLQEDNSETLYYLGTAHGF